MCLLGCLYEMPCVCLSDKLDCLLFNSSVPCPQSSLQAGFEDSVKKVSTCSVCFQCRYNSEICDYQDSSAIFFSLFKPCVGKKEREKRKASFSPRLQIFYLVWVLWNSAALSWLLCLWSTCPPSSFSLSLALSGFKDNFSLFTGIIFGALKILHP